MAKIIGLTGGIGSGKTSVALEFEKLGVPVYIADEEAKKILDFSETQKSLKTIFGNEIIKEGKINRRELAGIVFNNPEKLQQLNNIIHPQVKKHFSEWLKNYLHKPFVIKEAAILFESGSYLDCDKIISVTAPLETRIERVIKRDNSTRESVISRIQNQWTDEQRNEKSDYVITNIDWKNTKNQINKLYSKLAIL